jgi:hypothetical protein
VDILRRQQHPAASAEPGPGRGAVVTVGLGLLASYHLALALLMAALPHVFFATVGPFGIRNDHYIRDVATYNAAFGLGMALAVVRPSWRVPVLAITLAQFALHSVNHLLDADTAHPAWTGYVDLVSLAAGTVLVAWLLRAALGQRTSPLLHSLHRKGDPP